MTASSSSNWCQKHGTTNMTTGGCGRCAAERGATEACARGFHVRSWSTPTGGGASSACIHCGQVDDSVVAGDPPPPATEHPWLRDVARARAEVAGDARAQLWARLYAAVLSSLVNTVCDPATSARARQTAIGIANDAVADFDEHYLGGKR